jgi:hypothetical protein
VLLFLNSHVVWTLVPIAVSMSRVIVRRVQRRVRRDRAGRPCSPNRQPTLLIKQPLSRPVIGREAGDA